MDDLIVSDEVPERHDPDGVARNSAEGRPILLSLPSVSSSSSSLRLLLLLLRHIDRKIQMISTAAGIPVVTESRTANRTVSSRIHPL